MGHFFMTEPRVMVVQQPQRPGATFGSGFETPARPADSPTRSAEPRQLSLSDVIESLATAMAARPLQETPGDAFHRLAELRSPAEGISLADAYSRQSESTPELWDAVRDAAPRGY